MFALATSSHFTRSWWSWIVVNARSTFTAYEDVVLRVMEEFRRNYITSVDIHEGVNDETLQYLRNMKTLTFATAPKDGDEIFHLKVLLDVSKCDQPEIPSYLKTRSFDIDMDKIKDGVGRVFSSTISFNTEYRLTWLAESFTDYMIQYAAMVAKHQKLPIFTEDGFWDFIKFSPRHQSLPASVLLPQQGTHTVTDYCWRHCYGRSSSSHVRNLQSSRRVGVFVQLEPKLLRRFRTRLMAHGSECVSQN